MKEPTSKLERIKEESHGLRGTPGAPRSSRTCASWRTGCCRASSRSARPTPATTAGTSTRTTSSRLHETVEAVVRVQGDRTNRRYARLKYLIHDR